MPPFIGHDSSGLSIPQVAVLPVNDHLRAATSPPQICVAIVKCIPETRMSKTNDMEKIFFILQVNVLPQQKLCKFNYKQILCC
jgi:hypothetical protein